MFNQIKLVSELKRIFAAPVINPNINLFPISSACDRGQQDKQKIWR